MAKSKKSNSKGFTLIELLIVIIIIGILAAIAFVAYGSSTRKAHKSTAQATVSQVKTKLGVFEVNNGDFPVDQTALNTWLSSSTGGNSPALATTFGTVPATSGYTYTATPANCDNSTTTCTGFSLAASATKLGFDAPDVTASN